MLHYAIKLVLSAALIVVISEIAKRSSMIAGLIASLPIVSLMAIIWLWIDEHDRQKVANLSMDIFWLVPPSLTLFIALPPLLRTKLPFFASLGIAIAIMLATYGLMLVVLKGLGVKL